jgi:hypothetical protein
VGGVYLVRMSGNANSDRLFGSSTDEFVECLANEAVRDRSTISVQGLGSAYGAYIGEVIRSKRTRLPVAAGRCDR